MLAGAALQRPRLQNGSGSVREQIPDDFMGRLTNHVSALVAECEALRDTKVSLEETLNTTASKLASPYSPVTTGAGRRLHLLRKALAERFGNLTIAFDALDANKDGVMTFSELKNGLVRYEVEWMAATGPGGLRELFYTLDAKGLGHLGLLDWLRSSDIGEPDEEPSNASPGSTWRSGRPEQAQPVALSDRPPWSARRPDASTKHGYPMFSEATALHRQAKRPPKAIQKQAVAKPDCDAAWKAGQELLERRRANVEAMRKKCEAKEMQEVTGQPRLTANSRELARNCDYLPPWEVEQYEKRVTKRGLRIQKMLEADRAEEAQHETFRPQILSRSRVMARHVHENGEAWHERARRPQSCGRIVRQKQLKRADEEFTPTITAMARALCREGKVGDRLHARRVRRANKREEGSPTNRDALQCECPPGVAAFSEVLRQRLQTEPGYVVHVGADPGQVEEVELEALRSVDLTASVGDSGVDSVSVDAESPISSGQAVGTVDLATAVEDSAAGSITIHRESQNSTGPAVGTVDFTTAVEDSAAGSISIHRESFNSSEQAIGPAGVTATSEDIEDSRAGSIAYHAESPRSPGEVEESGIHNASAKAASAGSTSDDDDAF